MDTLDIIDGFSYSLNPWNGSISETLFPGLLNISGDSPFANSESETLERDGSSGTLIEPNGLSGRNISETPHFESCRDQVSCPTCSTTFSEKRSLNRHIRMTHTRSYSCPTCSRTFCIKGSLYRHISVVHTRDVAYSCRTCNQRFLRKDNLQRHERERHQKIEPVECMRCGQLVKDRSLVDHFKSQRCRGRDAVPAEHHNNTIREALLADIERQTEEDQQTFRMLSTRNKPDPLSTSTYLTRKAAEALEIWSQSEEPVFTCKVLDTEIFYLRGLTIRSIVRGLATDLIDDGLDGAIRSLAFMDHRLCPDTVDVHNTAIKWLDNERCHRLRDVLATIEHALNRWNRNLDSDATYDTTVAKFPERGRFVSAMHQPKSDGLPQFESVVTNNLTPAVVLQEHPVSDLDRTEIRNIDDGIRLIDESDKSLVPLVTTGKRKRKSTNDFFTRPLKRTTCPLPKCRKEVLQKALNRHMRTHEQDKPYQCEVAKCGLRFSRKDCRDRHQNEKHNGIMDVVECSSCGDLVNRRAMKGHTNSQKCKRSARKIETSERERNGLLA